MNATVQRIVGLLFAVALVVGFTFILIRALGGLLR